MEMYLAGVAVALFIGIVKVGVGLTTRFSTKAQNMAKLGLRYRAGFGSFEHEGSSLGGWIALVVWLVVLAPLGSWLSVASAGWTYISAKRKQVLFPEKVKAIQDLMARHEMSKEQLIEAQEEIHRVMGQPGAALTGEEDEDPLFLDMSDGDLVSTVQADPKAKLLTFSDHWSDGHDWWHSVEEYRFVDGQVQSRLTEENRDSMGRKEWSVKDGVVLESELRTRLGTREEDVIRFRKRVEWHPVGRLKLRYFIMSQHPAEFPLRERRRLIRTEIERIEAGARRVAVDAAALGLQVGDGKRGMELRYPDGFTDADKERVQTALEATYTEARVNSGEIYVLKELRKDLYQLLGEPVRS